MPLVAGGHGGTLESIALDESGQGSADDAKVDCFVSELEGERAALEIGRQGLPLVTRRP